MAIVQVSGSTEGNNKFTGIEEYPFLIAHDATERGVEPARVMIPAHNRQ